MPGTAVVGHQLVEVAIRAHQVMRTDLATAVGGTQGVQALLHVVLVGVVQHDDDRVAHVVVRRRYPRRQRATHIGAGAGGKQEGGEQHEREADSAHYPIVLDSRAGCAGPGLTTRMRVLDREIPPAQIGVHVPARVVNDAVRSSWP